MIKSHALIDDAGLNWPTTGAAVRDHLGARISGSGLMAFVVANLGWIEVRALKTGLQIRCRPSLVTEAALASLLYSLFDQPPVSVMLSLLTDRWHDMIHRHRKDTLTILAAMIGVPSVGGTSMQNRPLRQFVASKQSPLFRQTTEIMGSLETTTTEDDLVPLLDRLFEGRWTLSHIDQGTGEIVVDRSGSGFTPFNPAWTAPRPGTYLADCGDLDYAHWVGEFRREVAEAAFPVFDDVDALLRMPVGLLRLRYSRVTMPIRLSGRRLIILSASVSNHAIDLRRKVA